MLAHGYGRPRLLYCDRKNCYVAAPAKTIDEELAGTQRKGRYMALAQDYNIDALCYCA